MSVYFGNELCHHGIKGQHWGERNYQNPDGSLTAAGRERYRNAFSPKALGMRAFSKFSSASSAVNSGLNKVTGGKVKMFKNNASLQKGIAKQMNRMADNYQSKANAKRDLKDYGGQKAASTAKKAAIAGATVAAAALAAYGINKGVGKLAANPIPLREMTPNDLAPLVVTKGRDAVGRAINISRGTNVMRFRY